ncbi:MAG: hypothetical protein ACI90V_001130 [Bacillariaceae sp.]|jgi:hypothetical protein
MNLLQALASAVSTAKAAKDKAKVKDAAAKDENPERMETKSKEPHQSRTTS